MRLFWRAGLREKRLLALAPLHSVGAIFISTLAPLFVGKVIASLGHHDTRASSYLWYFTLCVVVGVICNRIGFTALLSHQARTMNFLQHVALDTLLKRSVGFHNNNVGGKLVSDAIDFPTAYSLLSSACVISLLPFIVVLAAGSVVVFIQSWILGLIITFMATFTVAAGVISSKLREPLRMRRLKTSKELTAHLADTIMNVQTVKTFAKETSEIKRNDQLGDLLCSQRLNDWNRSAREGNIRIALLFGMQLIFLLTLMHMVRRNPGLLAVGIFAFSFMITLSNRLFELNSLVRNIEDGLLQAAPMTEIILENTEITDAPHAKTLHVNKGGIELKDVTFEYHDETTSQTVFEKLSLEIRPGEKIGLVGPSGGGKTTFTRLLLRFDDIASGTIMVDGQDIAQVTQESLRSSISYVPQEPLLFHRSIRENISYGKPGAPLAAVRTAAQSAHADAFITNLKDGYETVVGERGVKLSGGQRQRVAIARAILKDAPILVLDEATSALDSESEKLIQDALWRLMKGRTAVVVAHRLSTIQKMDRIIVLDQGRIIEQGTHAELLAHKGLYAKLWAHQSGGFIEE